MYQSARLAQCDTKRHQRTAEGRCFEARPPTGYSRDTRYQPKPDKPESRCIRRESATPTHSNRCRLLC